MKKVGCAKCGGTMNKMAKGGSTTNKLNNPKGYAPAQKGGDNTKMGIYGVPNAGRTDSLGFKKGGSVKNLPKAQDGKTVKSGAQLKKEGMALKAKGIELKNKGTALKIKGNLQKANSYNELSKKLNNKNVVIAAPDLDSTFPGDSVRVYPGKSSGRFTPYTRDLGVKGVIDGPIGNKKDIIYNAKKKKSRIYIDNNLPNKMKTGGVAKAKFGATVNVQRGYPGKIRSANDQGYTAIGKREPARTKFAKGGTKFPDLTGDGKVTRADVLKGRGVIKKMGGSIKKK